MSCIVPGKSVEEIGSSHNITVKTNVIRDIRAASGSFPQDMTALKSGRISSRAHYTLRFQPRPLCYPGVHEVIALSFPRIDFLSLINRHLRESTFHVSAESIPKPIPTSLSMFTVCYVYAKEASGSTKKLPKKLTCSHSSSLLKPPCGTTALSPR